MEYDEIRGGKVLTRVWYSAVNPVSNTSRPKLGDS